MRTACPGCRDVLRLHTLGNLRLQGPKGELLKHRRKELALLAYLARRAPRPASRDALAALLWGERPEENARQSLRQALRRLRQEIGECLVVESDCIEVMSGTLTSDVAAFEMDVAAGRLGEAVSRWTGDFLASTEDVGTEAWREWLEVEREALRRRLREAFERLIRAEAERGAWEGAARWAEQWLAVLPFEDGPHRRLQEIERLRASLPLERAIAAPAEAGRRVTGRRLRTWLVAASAVAAAVFASVRVLWPSRPIPVLAVGMIRGPGQTDSAVIGGTLADMLATNLGRVRGLRVLSGSRMSELTARFTESDPPESVVVQAARNGGATELLHGTLQRRADGALQLDLVRVELRTGLVREEYEIEGSDPFTLVDRATAQIADGLAPSAHAPRVADVTTNSFVAYRLYEEGVRAYYQADTRSAKRLLTAALAEDSGFAMAAYFLSRANRWTDFSQALVDLHRAVELSDRTSERERLLIRAAWTVETEDPALVSIAETLAARYPTEPEGFYFSGRAQLLEGNFREAVQLLRRAATMDSLSLYRSLPHCVACDALWYMVVSYFSLDSFPAAERTAREWLRLQPQRDAPWFWLAWALEREGQYDAALAAARSEARLHPPEPSDALYPAMVALRRGDFLDADRLLDDLLRIGIPAYEADALFWMTIGLRYQGRLQEALVVARRYRVADAQGSGARPPYSAVAEAQVLFESGRYREAAALFDSIAATLSDPRTPTLPAALRSWMLTHEADALAAAGDTSMLERLADTVAALGRLTVDGRYRRLHHHVRGLLQAARGDLEDAEREFRLAIYSGPYGYSRTNYELARLLIRQGRAREAITVLAPALRGPLDFVGFYLTHSELHLLLARAFGAVGQADSAATHYRWVLEAWRAPDPSFLARRDSVRMHLSALAP